MVRPGVRGDCRAGGRNRLNRILLSVPHMSGREQRYIDEAFTSNLLSTVGPNLDAFERDFERRFGGGDGRRQNPAPAQAWMSCRNFSTY